MTLEIERAYPLLRRQWVGMQRLEKIKWDGTKGAPDFLLLSSQYSPVFAEVKCVETVDETIKLEVLQAFTLDQLDAFGCAVRVLTLCLDTSLWYLHLPKYFSGVKDGRVSGRRVLRCCDSDAEPVDVVSPSWMVGWNK